jgi:RimJ/RimL family protein N-acetyltransferase
MSAPLRFFRLECDASLLSAAARPYPFEVWIPISWRLTPAGFPPYPFAIWSAFHHLRVFRSREYRIVYLREGGRVVHRTVVFPSFFRFPFMRRDDLQFGDIWTADEKRGQGIASSAIAFALSQMRGSGRVVWYITEESNESSARVARNCGFIEWGRGTKRRVGGVNALARFHLLERFLSPNESTGRREEP